MTLDKSGCYLSVTGIWISCFLFCLSFTLCSFTFIIIEDFFSQLFDILPVHFIFKYSRGLYKRLYFFILRLTLKLE